MMPARSGRRVFGSRKREGSRERNWKQRKRVSFGIAVVIGIEIDPDSDTDCHSCVACLFHASSAAPQAHRGYFYKSILSTLKKTGRNPSVQHTAIGFPCPRTMGM